MVACARWLGRTSETCTRKPDGCICEKEEMMEQQCPSCGGFCKKSGCERRDTRFISTDVEISSLVGTLAVLSDDFECHAVSRSIDDVEAAGRAMRAAKKVIERMLAAIEITLKENGHLADGDNCTLIDLKRAIDVA